MTYRGKVHNGVVVLENGDRIPEGTEVRVELVQPTDKVTPLAELSPLFRVGQRARPTGIPDLAINHDHYLYGLPRNEHGR